MPHSIDQRDTFDAASIPGMRARLREHYEKFRKVEQNTAKELAPPAAGGTSGEYEDRSCPCCGAEPPCGVPVLCAHGLDIVSCPGCGLVYSRAVLNEESDASVYRTSVLDAAFIELRLTAPYLQLESARSKYYLSIIESYSDRRGSLLDVGCGSGTLLIEAAAAGWNVLGLEPNLPASEVARLRGACVTNGYFPQDLPYPIEKFDVITSLDVIEHLANPRSVIRSMWEHLNPSGLLFIQVPNWNSLIVQIEGEQSTIVCPTHWSYFSPNTLENLIAGESFENVAMQTVQTELDRIRDYPKSSIKAAFERIHPGRSLPEILGPKDIYANDLGYKLVGIFRKVEKAHCT